MNKYTGMRHALHVVLVLLLCCISGCLAVPEHRCIFDRIKEKARPREKAIVLNLPDRSQRRDGDQSLSLAVPEWEPIRIRFFTEDMKNPSKYCSAEGETRPDFTGGTTKCRAEDVFTEAKRSNIVNNVLPRAIRMHADRLLVQALNSPIIVPSFLGDDVCGSFKVPKSHHTEGVRDVDMVLYAAAGPMESSTLAWAASCAFLESGRPIVGVINFGPGSVTDSEYSVRVSTHEIAHALGFDIWTFNKNKLVKQISGLRGKGNVYVATSPKTLEAARAHYNCPTVPGMELEDEGGAGTASSHWKRRNAKDELMAGIAGAGYYTAFTMSIFDDMPFYRARWGMEEPMSWGNDSGCVLLTEKCLTDGVSAYPEMFCESRTDTNKCTSDRLSLGNCVIFRYDHSLLPQYQYFSDPTIGGHQNSLMDYCPYIEKYTNTECSHGESSVMPGSRIGPKSKCLKGSGLSISTRAVGDVCAEISCEKEEVSVRYLGDDTWYPCPEGSSIEPSGVFNSGIILCPTYAEVCSVFMDEGGSDNCFVVNGLSSLSLICAILVVLGVISM